MTDEMIMESVKRGELQQASLLFERYNRRIFNFLARMTMDRALAEDLTQNVFLRILKYRHTYREDARFQSWIYQVARNIFSDHYQATRNRFSDFVNVEEIGDKVEDAAESEQLEERDQLLHKSLAKLSPEQRELLVLTRFERMKYEEVATIMDTSVANIKVRVHRAMAKLRECYFEVERSNSD